MTETTRAERLPDEVTAEQRRELRAQAERCRQLAKSVTDPRASRVLADMAIGYERRAASLSQE